MSKHLVVQFQASLMLSVHYLSLANVGKRTFFTYKLFFFFPSLVLSNYNGDTYVDTVHEELCYLIRGITPLIKHLVE